MNKKSIIVTSAADCCGTPQPAWTVGHSNTSHGKGSGGKQSISSRLVHASPLIGAAALACAGLLSSGSPLRAAPLFFQGFEQNTNGWDLGTQNAGSGNYGITRYQSGASSPVGTINAASGGYYAVVNNATSNYLNGYGDAGYAVFGGGTNYPGPSTMSISVYLNASSWANSNTAGQGFMIDESPTAALGYTLLGSSASYAAGAPDFNMEGGFQLGSNGTGGLAVWAYYHNQTTGATESTANLAVLSTTGWYTFSQTISQSANGPFSTFSIYDNNGNLVGSSATVDWTSASNADLGGPNYLWLTGWYNGFSNNTMAIDNVTATPEPTSLALLGIAAVGAILLLPRRRQRVNA